MWRFILKRLLSLIPVIAGVIFVVFIILHMAPGDPARLALGDEAEPQAYIDWREERGLNDPVLIQYFRYMFKIVQGDFGTSYGRTQTPVFGEIMAKFPYTLALALCAMVITLLFAFPLGVLAAVKHNSWFDNISMFFSLIGVSMPTFWLGMLLILYFALGKGWFPTTGAGSWNAVILPAVSIGFGAMAGMARTTRSSMLEVVRQDYIRTARAKGISFGRVIRRHAIRNSMIPTITVMGLQLGNLIASSVVIERVFTWPGIGNLMIQSILGNDYPMVLGCMVLFTLCFSIINLIVDLAYAFVDPRIRAQYK